MQNFNSKFKSFATVLTLILFTFTFNFSLFTFNFSAEALTMSNSNYKLYGDLNMSGGNPTGSNYKLRTSMGQIAPGESTAANYKIKSGFQHAATSSAALFSFSISENLIDFGIISPTNPVTRTNTLTVTSGANYQVLGLETAELKDPNSNFVIPDTTCDNGTCSETTSSLWTNTLTFGFGYRCDNVSGTDCASGFTDINYFKQLPNQSKSETSQKIMAGSGGSSKSSKITYKLNIAATQPSGTYSNEISYVATTTF